MKARHIVMIMILILFATIMFSLKDAKNTKTLICSVNSDFQGFDSKINLDIKIKDKEIKDMDIVIDSVLPEEYLSEKQAIINQMNASGKMEVESTKEGLRFKTGIQSEYFKSLGISTKTSYGELKEALEFQGFNCK